MNSTPRTDSILANENDFYAHDTFVRLTKLCRELEVELKNAEQIDNAANHYLSRAEKAEAELTELRAKLIAAHGEIEQQATLLCAWKGNVAAYSREALLLDRAEKAEADCVKLNRLLIMSRDDRENDLMSEIDEQARLLGLSANQNAILLTKVNNLSALWSQFIYIMDIIEESDSGNEFRPNRILSCRALDAQKMSDIIEKAKLVVNAGVKSEH
jgi:hypothetical protein